MDEYSKKVDEKITKINEVKEKYLSRFYLPEEIEETFGQYLEVLYDYAGREDRIEDYKMARKEFLALYNGELLNEYFSYIGATEQEQYDIRILIEQYQKEESSK